MMELHFLRPLWFLALLPLALLFWFLRHQRHKAHAWNQVCDAHLLNHLLKHRGNLRPNLSIYTLLVSALLMIISLSGPSWSRLPVPSFKEIQPRVVILDMSDAMLAADLSPDRLSRAKFKLRDLFTSNHKDQFGLVVYSGEPFTVSPLTDDAKTIAALVPALTEDVMPVDGHRLDLALREAGDLITQAGFRQGEILVLSANPPSTYAINTAKTLAMQQIHTSVIPVRKEGADNPLYQSLATAGQGRLIPFTHSTADIEQWLKTGKKAQYRATEADMPLWQDEGRWFLIPALLLLLPAFRRGWLKRIGT